MSTIKKKPMGSNVRSESDQPRDPRVLSPSPDVKEYFQYTRNFPSSNPIKSARPDLLSFVERIPMTQNPGGPNLMNRREMLKRSQDPDKENVENHLLSEIDRLNDEIKGKDEEIRKLKHRNTELEKMSNDLKASVHSFQGTPMKEKEAKDLAKRFAKERLQAEADAEEWRQRYKNLEKRLREMEAAEPKEVIVKKEAPKEKDTSKEQLQQFQTKILDLESKVLSLTNENDKLKSMMKERNTEIDNLKVRIGSKDREIDELKTEIRKVGDKTPLDAKIKDLTGQIEIWRNKANLLEEQWEKEQKRSKDLQESRDKYESDLKNVKNDLDQAKKLISKLENVNQELEKLRLEIEGYKRKLEEMELLRKNKDDFDAKCRALSQELEALKQKSAHDDSLHAQHAKEIEVWRKRCDDIEKEWGEKHKALEFEMDELGLMTANLKEHEDQLAALSSENENWKAKCLDIETEWNEKHGKILKEFEKLKAGRKEGDSEGLLATIFLLMTEMERLNVLIKLLEAEREKDEKMRNTRIEKDKKSGFEDHAAKLALLNEELARKDMIIGMREKEIEELNRKIEGVRASQSNADFLKDKIIDLERQIAKMENLGSENSFLKEKLHRIEEELDRQRNMTDTLRRSQYERDIRAEKSTLEGEVSKWRALYDNSSKEIESLKRKLFDESQKRPGVELENKLMLLATENERLSREIEQFKAKSREESTRMSQSLEIESRVKFLNSEIERISAENSDLKGKYYEELAKKGQYTDLESKVKFLTAEVDRLSSENVRKSQSSDLESRVRLLTGDVERLSRENSELKQRYFEELSKKQQSPELESRVKYLSTEVERLSTENSEVKQRYYEEAARKSQFTDLESKVKQLSEENERLTKELSDTRQKYYEDVSKRSQSFELETRMKYMTVENERLASENAELRRKLLEESKKGGANVELENKLVLLATENERMKQEIDYWRRMSLEHEAEKRQIIEQSDDKLRRVHEESAKRSQLHTSYIEQDLKEKNNKLTQEIEDWKSRNGRLEIENKKLIEGATTTSSELMNLEFELEVKNKKLKEMELLLQERTNSTIIQSEQLAKDNERLRIDLEEIKRKYSLLELETYKKGNLDSENQRKVALLQAEIDRNSQLLADKVKENKALLENNLQKTRDVEESMIKLRIAENQMGVLDSKIKGLVEEIDAWRVRYENLERFKSKEFEDLKIHSEAIRKSQLDREIRDLTIKHENEKMRLEAELKRVQGMLEIQNGELAILKGKSVERDQIKRLEENFFMVSSENERLLSQVQTLNERLRDVEMQRTQLSDYYQEQQRSHVENVKRSAVSQVENLQSELDRLNKELEEWKAKARKAELDIYGVSSLNIQISELKQKLMNLTKDQEGLMATLNEKKLYIEKLREKKRVMKQRLRSSLAGEQRSQVLLREIDETKAENMRLRDEITRLQQRSYASQSEVANNYSLQVKQEEMNRLSLRLQTVERDLDLRVGEIKDWQAKYYQIKAESQNPNEMNELVKRCSTLEYENQSLRIDLERSQEEKSQSGRQERGKKAFAAEGEEKQHRINALAEELERWKERCRELENSSADKRFLEKKVKEWEQRVNALLIDNERLLKEKAALEMKMSETLNSREGLDKVKLQKLEERRMKDIEELQGYFENLKTTLFDSRGVEFEAERMAYETALTQMKDKVVDLERTGALIMKESEDNKMLLALKLRELDETKSRVRYYEERGAIGVSEESEKLRRQIADQKDLVIKLENEKRSLGMQVDQLSFSVRSLQAEVERLNVSLEERKKERNENLQLIEQLRRENQSHSLNGRTSFGVQPDIYGYEEMNKNLNKRIQEIEISREFYKSQADRNSMELTSKNMELIEKIQELENLKSKYQDSLNNLQRLEAKLLERLQQEEILIV